MCDSAVSGVARWTCMQFSSSPNFFFTYKNKTTTKQKKAPKTAMNIEWGRLPIAMVVSLFLLSVVVFFSNVKGHSRPFSFSLTLACPTSRIGIDFHLTSFMIRYYFGKVSTWVSLRSNYNPGHPASRLKRFRSINLQYWSQCGHFGIKYLLFLFFVCIRTTGPRPYTCRNRWGAALWRYENIFSTKPVYTFFLNNRIFFVRFYKSSLIERAPSRPFFLLSLVVVASWHRCQISQSLSRYYQ